MGANTATKLRTEVDPFEGENCGASPSPARERVKTLLKGNESPLRVDGAKTAQKGNTKMSEETKTNGNGETQAQPMGKTPVRAVDIMPEADVYKAAEVEGVDITVRHIKFQNGEFGEFVSLDFEADLPSGEHIVGNVINSGTVIQDKLRRIAGTVNQGQPVLLRFVMQQPAGKRAYWDIE